MAGTRESNNDDKRSSGVAAPARARPAFRRTRKGYEPAEVGRYLETVELERSDLAASLARAQARADELQARLDRYEALEEELTRSVRLAEQTGAAVLADAENRAAERMGRADREVEALMEAGRRRLAEEERSLDGLRMAVAAEAAMLKDVEAQLATRISRAAAALVEIVDAPGGLGPFSQATATLLEFAQLLHRMSRNGTAMKVSVGMEDGVPVARVGAE